MLVDLTIKTWRRRTYRNSWLAAVNYLIAWCTPLHVM